jgi:hypothetical protein
MTGELCPDCGQLRAPHDQALSDFLAESPGAAVCWVNRDDYCQGGLLACLKAQLAQAQRENEAWRALATRGGRYGGLLIQSQANALQSHPWQLGFSQDGFGHADTVQAAAIDLATKLGLIGTKP